MCCMAVLAPRDSWQLGAQLDQLLGCLHMSSPVVSLCDS